METVELATEESWESKELHSLEFEELVVGNEYCEQITITEEMHNAFIQASGDTAILHINNAAAKKAGFERRIVHGLFVSTFFSRMLGMKLPGEKTVIQSIKVDFCRPVYLGELLSFHVTVKKVVSSVKAVELDLKVKRDNTTRVKGAARCIYVLN